MVLLPSLSLNTQTAPRVGGVPEGAFSRAAVRPCVSGGAAEARTAPIGTLSPDRGYRGVSLFMSFVNDEPRQPARSRGAFGRFRLARL